MNKKCQVFTPENYVRELLDSVGYTHNLYGKKILENSCGDGNILVAVVQRYIDDCKENGLSTDIDDVDTEICRKEDFSVIDEQSNIENEKEQADLYVEESREMDDGDAKQIYTGERKTIEDEVAVTQGASDKAQRIAERLSACGAYEEINAAVKADIFVLDIADVSGSIRLFSDVMKRLGIKLDGDEFYEEFQRIYNESVGRNAGKEKVEDKMWNMGRGR